MALDENQQKYIGASVMFAAGIVPLRLSTERSVNLAKITSYEFILDPDEVDDDHDADEGGKGKKKPAAEPRLVPAIYFEGGGELILSDAENKVFRPYWNNYCKLALNIFVGVKDMVDQQQTFFPPAPEAQQ